MTVVWADYPSNWAKPGHIPKGNENEAILDRLLLLTPTQFAYKTADETIISNGTYQNDDHLAIPVEASGVYFYIVKGGFSASTTADFRHKFLAPSGSFSACYYWYFNASNANQRSNYTAATDAAVTGLEGAGVSASGSQPFEFGGVFTCGTTGGTLQWQWAQNTSTADNTTVRAGSTLTAYRVA